MPRTDRASEDASPRKIAAPEGIKYGDRSEPPTAPRAPQRSSLRVRRSQCPAVRCDEAAARCRRPAKQPLDMSPHVWHHVRADRLGECSRAREGFLADRAERSSSDCDSPRVPTQLRHAPAGGLQGHPHGAGTAGPQRHTDDDGLHPRSQPRRSRGPKSGRLPGRLGTTRRRHSRLPHWISTTSAIVD